MVQCFLKTHGTKKVSEHHLGFLGPRVKTMVPPLREQPTRVLREMLESLIKYDDSYRNLNIYKEIEGIIRSREKKKSMALVDEFMFV